MVTIAKQIDPSPPAPSRQDPINFDVKGDAMLAFIEDKLVPQVNAVSAQLNAQADEAIAQGIAATQAAQVAAQAKSDSALSATSAQASADLALEQANVAVTKATAALASANAAAAIQGIPTVDGNALKTLRVNAAGTGIEWTQTGDALGFMPVQQGGGNNMGSNKICMGWGTDSGLIVQVDSTYLGYATFSSTNPTLGTLNYTGKTVVASTFNGAHLGNGAGLVGLTSAQITTALNYTPMNAASFAPGGLAEIGRYLDFHAVNSANDYDIRIACRVPTGGPGTGVLDVTCSAAAFGGIVYAGGFSGGGAYLTGITYAQLPYVPARNANAVMTGGASVISGGSNFDGNQQQTLMVQSADSGNSASMQFLRTNAYGIKVGLDASNSFCVGGWSNGSNVFRFYSDGSGNFTASGNITAYSDMRFKTQISRLTDVVKTLKNMEEGGFQYIDTRTGEWKYGVSAQAFEKTYPWAVEYDIKGVRSVAYGQIALAALMEVNRELDDRLMAQDVQMLAMQTRIDHLFQLLGTKK